MPEACKQESTHHAPLTTVSAALQFVTEILNPGADWWSMQNECMLMLLKIGKRHIMNWDASTTSGGLFLFISALVEMLRLVV